MPYLQLAGRSHPLVLGENALGGGADCRVQLAGNDVADVAAVIAVGPDGTGVIRRAGTADVKVNAVALGAEPVPLIHGDKIEIGGQEVIYGDDRRAGSTQMIAPVRLPAAAPARAADGAATPASGGRLVSLVDGREYRITTEVVIGRDPSCDVVVPVEAVSRRHAVIAPGPSGYVLTDTSVNGVQVNGSPVASSARLVRGDVITVGGEDFRFYAESVPAPSVPAPAPAPAPSSPPPSVARPVLATLEVVSSGVLHGLRFPIHAPLAHIGRGAYNDVVIPDDSVSDAHAKLQRRDDGWYVVDVGSTNGTYVGGRRIAADTRLVGAPDLRVGGIKFIFRSGDGEADAGHAGGGQTRAIAALTPEQRAKLAAGSPATQPAAPAVPEAPVSEPATRTRDRRRSGISPRVVLLVLLLVVLAVILLRKGR